MSELHSNVCFNRLFTLASAIYSQELFGDVNIALLEDFIDAMAKFECNKSNCRIIEDMESLAKFESVSTQNADMYVLSW
jgi:hypothetical protein